MKNINQIKILIILGLLCASAFVLYKFPINLGLDLQGGVRLVLEAVPTDKVKISDDSMAGVLAVIRNRIDALGVSEPVIMRKGFNQVVVELPGVTDPQRAKSIVGDTALLEFAEAEWSPADLSVLSENKVKEIYGKTARIGKVEEKESGQVVRERPIILKGTVLTGADLKWVGPSVDQYGNPVIDLEFKPEGADMFSTVTARNVGKPIAILLDNKVISAPNVREPIPSGRAQISGDFSVEEVQDMVIKLKAGSLPLPVRIIADESVGPTLGKDSLDKSKFAGIAGFIFIVFFMVLYYRLPGFLADIALVVYFFLVMGVLALLRTTFTLPGIAGILLSIGMAVDTNVLIFERLKEELRLGKSLKVAIDASFHRAFPAILDSHVTTIIGAAVLFWVGTGTLKGFAVTLSVGVLFSLFTAIIITRMLIDMMVDSKIISGPETKLIYK